MKKTNIGLLLKIVYARENIPSNENYNTNRLFDALKFKGTHVAYFTRLHGRGGSDGSNHHLSPRERERKRKESQVGRKKFFWSIAFSCI